jgi:FixJ family two-component response regulator
MSKAVNERIVETLSPIKVAIIDDEEPMRKALARLLKSAGMEVAVFSSAPEFLDDRASHQVDCAVTDLRMPGIDGLGFQEVIGRTLPHLSLVFITGHASVPASVKAMKGGAVDFLEKPVDAEVLLAAVRHAVERSRALKAQRDELDSIERHYRQLTAREREVFALVVAGRLNKQAGFDLGIAEKTIKVHRARVMEKMAADSLADLVRMAERLGVTPERTSKTSA